MATALKSFASQTKSKYQSKETTAVMSKKSSNFSNQSAKRKAQITKYAKKGKK